MRKIIFKSLSVAIVIFLLAACGGDSCDNPNFERVVSGGIARVGDHIKVEFPSGSFSDETNVDIAEIEDENSEMSELYEVNAVMYDASKAYNKFIRITATEQPRIDAKVRYEIPPEFISEIGEDFRPRLFAQLYQEGADGEVLDYFEPLNYEFDGSVLTTNLPPYFFTDGRNPESGQYEAILLLGSSPRERVEQQNNYGTKFVDRNPATNTCQGSTLSPPVDGTLEVTSAYGNRIHPIVGQSRFHAGVDLRAASGDPVRAAAGGTVERIGWNVNANGTGYGRYVVLQHDDGSHTLYAHLIENSTESLATGQRVDVNEQIGQVGTTGGVTGPHLHFEYAPTGDIYDDDNTVNPYPCINANMVGQITIKDNGPLADDAFEFIFDGKKMGETSIGASNTFGANNLRPGAHEIEVIAIVAPDDRGTVNIHLANGVTFEDGETSKSTILSLGDSIKYIIIVN